MKKTFPNTTGHFRSETRQTRVGNCQAALRVRHPEIPADVLRKAFKLYNSDFTDRYGSDFTDRYGKGTKGAKVANENYAIWIRCLKLEADRAGVDVPINKPL